MTDDEALRRRLYRPGAGEEDVAAYRAAVAVAEPPERLAEARPPRHRHRSRVVVAVAAVAAAAAVVAGGAPVLLRARAATPATVRPLPTARVVEATRARFVAALDAGRDAGLGAWRSGGAPYLEAHGTGSGTVALPVAASGRGGRLLVLLVLDRDTTAGWATARLVIHDDRTIHLRTEASAAGAVRAGIPVEGRVVYPAEHRPLRLLVRAPDRVRWGAAVVFEP